MTNTLDSDKLANGARTVSEREYISHAISCAVRQGQYKLADYLQGYLEEREEAEEALRATRSEG